MRWQRLPILFASSACAQSVVTLTETQWRTSTAGEQSTVFVTGSGETVTVTDGSPTTLSIPTFTFGPVSTAIPSPTAAPDALIPAQAPLPPKQSWCTSEIFCAGPLLQSVSLAELYVDDKTFVDKPTFKTPQVVLADFNSTVSSDASLTVNDIFQFVQNDFGSEGYELEPIPIAINPSPPFLDGVQDPLVKEFARTVHGYWGLLGRRMNQTALCDGTTCESTQIPLNHSFIIPGGRFREQYYWDSFWIVEGLLQSQLYELVNSTLQNFMDELDTFGFIPNGARTYQLNRSQPPLFTQMLAKYVEATNDMEILKRALPLAEKELKWFSDNRSMNVTSPSTNASHRVFFYSATNTSAPRPESYHTDYMTANDPAISPPLNETQKANLYAELAAGAESGWDYTVRWYSGGPEGGLKTLDVRQTIAVDLNSIIYKNHIILADLYGKLNATTVGAPSTDIPSTDTSSTETAAGQETKTTTKTTRTRESTSTKTTSSTSTRTTKGSGESSSTRTSTHSTTKTSTSRTSTRTSSETGKVDTTATTPTPAPTTPSSSVAAARLIESHLAAAASLKAAILDLFWDPVKLAFYDFSTTHNARNSIFSVASFYPFWAGILPPEMLTTDMGQNAKNTFGAFSSVLMMLSRYNGTYPTTWVDSGLQWDAPNSWPPHQYVILEALRSLPANLTLGADLPITVPTDGFSSIPSLFSYVPVGQLGLTEDQLPGQPISGLDWTTFVNASKMGRAADINLGYSLPGTGSGVVISVKNAGAPVTLANIPASTAISATSAATPATSASNPSTTLSTATKPGVTPQSTSGVDGPNTNVPGVSGATPIPNWAAQLGGMLANRYVSAVLCSWRATGGSIEGILPRLSDTQLNITKSLNGTGTIYEKFSAIDIDSAGRGGEYAVQAGFGWTNGVLLWVAKNYGDAIGPPDCPEISLPAPPAETTNERQPLPRPTAKGAKSTETVWWMPLLALVGLATLL